jgi:hypothetical protein
VKPIDETLAVLRRRDWSPCGARAPRLRLFGRLPARGLVAPELAAALGVQVHEQRDENVVRPAISAVSDPGSDAPWLGLIVDVDAGASRYSTSTPRTTPTFLGCWAFPADRRRICRRPRAIKPPQARGPRSAAAEGSRRRDTAARVIFGDPNEQSHRGERPRGRAAATAGRVWPLVLREAERIHGRLRAVTLMK